MKRLLLSFSILLTSLGSFAEGIQWMSWEDAIAANKKNPKMIFVDVYTDWCGWCKTMDRNTFADSAVAAYMSANFYCVKFDAEQKTDISYNGTIFKYKPEWKSHELAVRLLNGQMSYPSFVILNKKEQIVATLKGYKAPSMFLPELQDIFTKNS